MKIRSAVPENGYLVFFYGRKTKKNKKKQKTENRKKNICKTYNRRLRKQAGSYTNTMLQYCFTAVPFGFTTP